MRGWNEVLSRQELLERVLLRLTPHVASLLRDPPAVTEWVDLAYYECVAEAVRLEVGEDRLDKLFVDVERVGLAALITRWLSGIVRIFGPSPAVILRHASAAAKQQSIGLIFEWEDTGSRSGELTLTFPHRPRMHLRIAWGGSAAIQLLGDLVGAKILRETPVMDAAPSGGTRVRVKASW